MSKKKHQFKCDVCGATFYNWNNYFNHQKHCRQWETKGVATINKALEMLKCTFEGDFKVIQCTPEYKVIQDEEKIAYPMEYIDMKNIVCKYKDKSFNLINYIFRDEDYTSASNIYFKIMQYYILPFMAGFDTYEEYEFYKLPKEEQELARPYLENWKEEENV